MQCPQCQSDNPADARFCNKCGSTLELACPQCGKSNPPDSNFCNGCGQSLVQGQKPVEKAEPSAPTTGGERKHVTVLFSDLSGYTAMSEKLDPEEVKEIMSRVFGRIKEVIAKYDGFIEKFAGDAVMAIFGVPRAHEDDPVRAIRAAREIHDLVKMISPEVEGKTAKPLSMHSGITTGLVVTGEVNPDKGTHGVAGDPLNLAARLCSLAADEEILVGQDTHRRSGGYFTFEELEPTRVKGKAEPVSIYRVLAAKDRPAVTRRPSRPAGKLIGRKFELAQLTEAADQIQTGRGAIVSISGDAGTGKSRLVEEFRSGLNLDQVQWLEGHAYAYSQNMPYFQLIDMLNRALLIEEGDSPEKVREKIETGLALLIGENNDIVPYIGSLYALDYPEAEAVSPEFWKSRLREAMQAVLATLTRNRPAVICLEDIHWADPSSIDLLRYILSEFHYPALFLCVYRLPFSLFTGQQQSSLGKFYREIQLQDLSVTEAQSMMESLLESENIPGDLRKFVQEKVEGNPFYLEEVINALIESKTLIRDNGAWQLTQSIHDIELSSSVYGVISSRLDRLEVDTKRVLQEASVIGRAFLYDILEKISQLEDRVDRCLSGLERLDIIRARSIQPELEYIFKHAITQEVVYNNLLKKERREIHERIGSVIEQLFKDRLAEFYETLAYHFKQGQSLHKAVTYLMLSGEKSMKKYAVAEADQYYTEAFEILTARVDRTAEEDRLLIDLLIKWAYTLYYLGDFKKLNHLLSEQKQLAESLDDSARLGMFYSWMGMTLWARGKYTESYDHLTRALELGEKISSAEVIGYACTWLSWTCTELGRLEEGRILGQRAHEISKDLKSDKYLYFKSLGGIGYNAWVSGQRDVAHDTGNQLLSFGQKHSNIRSSVMGYFIKGCGYFMNGELEPAIECFKEAVKISADPYYEQFPRLMLGMVYVINGDITAAEELLQAVLDFSQQYGTETIGTVAQVFLGLCTLSNGKLNRGIKMVEAGQKPYLENDSKWRFALVEHILGKVYFQMTDREARISPLAMVKNIGFLLTNLPVISRKIEQHFNKAIALAQEVNARGILAQAYLDFGIYHLKKNRKDKARECMARAIVLFDECRADGYLKQAQRALEQLNDCNGKNT
jgi:class 3 adenylate cyclase/tetratricopeptide (TPR) repeat protein